MLAPRKVDHLVSLPFFGKQVKKSSPFGSLVTSVTTTGHAGCAVEHGPMKPCLRFCPDGVGTSKQLDKEQQKKWGWWLLGGLFVWLFVCLVGLFVCLFVCLFAWLVGWVVGWLVGWLGGCCWLLWVERYNHYHVMFLMEEILHHLGCTEPCENWYIGIFYILFICTCQCQVVQQSAVVYIRTRKGMVLCPGLLHYYFPSQTGRGSKPFQAQLHICALAASFWV